MAFLRLYLLLPAALALAATPAHVVHVIVDDLGYDDLNYKNGQVHTPVLDAMHAAGVDLPDLYGTYECSCCDRCVPCTSHFCCCLTTTYA